MDKASCSYRLRKGLIIQPFGGGIITNDNLTDAIAEQALRDHTANPSMFAVMPEAVEEDSNLEIVPPASTENKDAIIGAPANEAKVEIKQDSTADLKASEELPKKPEVKAAAKTTEKRSHKATTNKKK